MKFIKFILAVAVMVIAMPSFAQFTTGGKSTAKVSTENVLATGYKGFVDAGYAFGVGDDGADRVLLTTSHGYQVNQYFFAGIGAGFNYYTDAELYSIPIFADLRGSFPITNTKVAPFFDLKIGYSVGDVEGFYIAPGLGVRIAVSNKVGFNIGLGYEMQKIKYDGYYYDGTFSCGGFAIKLGFDF